jgi:hypothetical protein
LTTGAVEEGLEHHHNAVGVIDFEFDGVRAQLVVLFTDATSGVTTYPGGEGCRSRRPATAAR